MLSVDLYPYTLKFSFSAKTSRNVMKELNTVFIKISNSAADGWGECCVLPGLSIDDEIGLAAIEDVQPGGHFFGTEHTLARYDRAFYAPMISDWRNFESWQEAGSPSATDHAHRVYKTLLENYEEPTLDLDRKEAIDAFIAKRKEEITRNGLN